MDCKLLVCLVMEDSALFTIILRLNFRFRPKMAIGNFFEMERIENNNVNVSVKHVCWNTYQFSIHTVVYPSGYSAI